jgi:predicted RNA binding protein YcfA (HicA-like mRNA interferase family)
LNYRTFIKILEANEFSQVRQKGSHRIFNGTVAGKKMVVLVAYHQISKDILPKNFASMIRQSGLNKDLFR